jgi:hypothetical protein
MELRKSHKRTPPNCNSSGSPRRIMAARDVRSPEKETYSVVLARACRHLEDSQII